MDLFSIRRWLDPGVVGGNAAWLLPWEGKFSKIAELVLGHIYLHYDLRVVGGVRMPALYSEESPRAKKARDSRLQQTRRK
jgi:hypothetical protein